ncbi:MAG TPA: hypothetical protein VE136_05295 [Anaerolineales bacterium]|nr:hypothetical protein [Anaerolineales bacterium]
MEPFGIGVVEIVSALLIALIILAPVLIVFLLIRRAKAADQNSAQTLASQQEIKQLLEKALELLEENNRLLKR